MPSLFVIIPVYNERDISLLLSRLQQSLRSLNFSSVQIIIVDDGSSFETTFDLPLDPNFTVQLEQLIVNQGPGAAFAHGFTCLPFSLKDDDYVLLLEGDGTSNLELIPKLLQRLNEYPDSYDLVLASPYIYGGSLKSLSFFRRILSAFANEMSRLVLDLRGIWTISSFYRLFRGSSITRLQGIHGRRIIQSDGFECMLELLVKSVRLDFKISEIASVVDQSNREGKSKMRIFRTIVGYFNVWKISTKI